MKKTISRAELNGVNTIVTGLDGHGTTSLIPIKDICESMGDTHNLPIIGEISVSFEVKLMLALPEGVESMILYVQEMTDECQAVINYCIGRMIPITVQYYDSEAEEMVTQVYLSRNEAKRIAKAIKSSASN